MANTILNRASDDAMVPDSFKGPEHGVLAVLRVEWDIPKLLKVTSVMGGVDRSDIDLDFETEAVTGVRHFA